MGSSSGDETAETLVTGSGAAARDAAPGAPDPPELVDEGTIGEGGSGLVLRALDRSLRRRVAVKTLAPRSAQNPRAVERLVQEAQITAQLEHPNIVPVHQLKTDLGGRTYFTMRLIEGQTFGSLIADCHQGEMLTERLHELLQAFTKVCDAVAFAHSRGVVHSDIKPENIMVGAYGEVYLMDWGISAVCEPQQNATLPAAPGQRLDVKGTPAYMAPEQAEGRGHAVDQRTDIFGLGAVLFEVLTGNAPFAASTVAESRHRARSCKVTIPDDSFRGGVPSGIARVVLKAMAARPDDRYQTVGDLRRDLDQFLRGGWNLPSKTFRQGTVIVAEGDLGEEAYIITKGTCDVTKQVDGSSQTIRTLGPGDVFGEMAILSGDTRTATVRAVTEVAVRVVTRELLREHLGVDSWLGRLVIALADRFRNIEDRAESRDG